ESYSTDSMTLRPVLPPRTSAKSEMPVTALPSVSTPETRNASVRNPTPPSRNDAGSAGNDNPDSPTTTHRDVTRLPGLLGGAHQHVVDRHPTVAGHHEEHRVGDILRQHLDHAGGLAFECLPRVVGQMAEDFGIDRPGTDDSDPDPLAEDL